jgi:hypothetical protein
MALGSTQPLTEMNTRNLPKGKGLSEHTADNLIAICKSIVYKMWRPRRLTCLWASTAFYDRIALIKCTLLYKYTSWEIRYTSYHCVPALFDKLSAGKQESEGLRITGLELFRLKSSCLCLWVKHNFRPQTKLLNLVSVLTRFPNTMSWWVPRVRTVK